MKELKEINKKTTLLLIFIILVLSIILILSLTGEIHLQPKEEFKSILTKNNETPAGTESPDRRRVEQQS